MATKKLIHTDTTGWTVYLICVRQSDGYLLDDSDGNFAAAPADPYVALTEHSTVKGRYAKDESRQVWTDGSYDLIFYRQLGGSPAPSTDIVIGNGEMYVVDDAETVLDANPSTRLAAVDYTAPDNASITAIQAKTDNLPADPASQAKLTDLHDEAFGKWTLDPTAKTLTLYRANGTVLKVFNLTDTSSTVPAFIQRTPV